MRGRAMTSESLRNREFTPKISRRDVYKLADVVEWKCLQDADHEISISEGLDECLGGKQAIGGLYEYDDQDAELIPTDESNHTDSILFQVKDSLSSRGTLFGDSYPFLLKGSLLSVKENITDSMKLYIFLLIASHLDFLERDQRKKLTDDFEVASFLAVKNLIPNWTIKTFGTAPSLNYEGYTGSPRRKIESFASDIGLQILMDEQELKRLETPNGDAGLDTVAWFAFDDQATHMPVILVQAGCTSDESKMFEKQHSASIARWAQKLKGLTAIGIMSTPQCYRLSNNEWIRPSEIQNIFLDRARIMHLLSVTSQLDISFLSSINLVNSFFDAGQS